MKRVLAISLLFVFITGLVNLTWATHYCGNFAVENAVSIGIEKLSCSTEEKSCCAEGENVIYGPVIKSKMCCSNDYYSSDADDFFIKVDTESEPLVHFYVLYTLALYKQIYSSDNNFLPTKSITILIPPDRQVLYQTFLL